jgi:hypothetical protein
MLFLCVCPCLKGQVERPNVSENRLKLESEPALYFNMGRSLLGSYSITKDNNFSIGLYFMTTNVPESFANRLLTNVSENTSVRVTQEYALNFRYIIRIFKNIESNPFVGLITGWENIRLQKDGTETLDIGTFLVTPHIGYEFYVYKRMLFINPQFRTAFYFGQSKSDVTRPEQIKRYMILPSITLGLRL